MKGDAIVESERPRIGMLGIMQELYDEMIPRITEHQAEFSKALCEQLSPVADVIFTRPARNRDDIEEIVRDLNTKDLDGIMIVMLTYGPAMRTLRALQQNPLPLLLANIPVSSTHLRAHETGRNLVCRLLLEKKKKKNTEQK